MIDTRLIRLIFKLLVFLWLVLPPQMAASSVLTSDTVWNGEVLVSEDVLVPEGVTLTITAGTTIKVASSESTKTDPEYMSPLTEITIRGVLNAAGTRESPIIFLFNGEKRSDEWAGIIVDGGTANVHSCRIQDAETGMYVIKGSAVIRDSIFTKNRYGLIAQGEGTRVHIKNTEITGNDYGVFTFEGARVHDSASVVKDNRKKDVYSFTPKEYHSAKEYTAKEKGLSRQYGDDVLFMDTVWRGRIEIDGIIRVPEGSRLIILPGAIVEFKRKDTNGDGIGENGLLIQGVLIAKGERENPIIFRSAEKHARMGDWDAVNIMNSDGAQNLVEYCQIEDAYRGVHFHFSNVAVKESVLKNNYRAIQFQESTAEISGNMIEGNKSGIQARDSEITFMHNTVSGNHSGVNFFRSTLEAKGNTIVNNLKEGMRVREGIPTVEENLIDGNRYGLMAADSLYGKFSGNIIVHNLETGMSLKDTDALEVSGNFIQGNGLNGISIQGSAAAIRGNVISLNGERGIGITAFRGSITGNSIAHNGLYAVGLEGTSDVSAPMNWWGGDDLRQVIYDKENDPARGRVNHNPVRKGPIMFPWPLSTVPVDVVWCGEVNIHGVVAVPPDAVLSIAPGTRVAFSKGSGLKIAGKIVASGKKDERITFTAAHGRNAGTWEEIFLDHATGSAFSYCDFEYATWGIHSHFTNLMVGDCSFRKNYGGMRFQSGPVEVRRSLFEENSIGLRAFRGSALITENVITRNETGIFIREKGGGLTIKRNNIFSNSDYNVRIGDFNEEDVDATENWWGGGDVIAKIFDGRKEPGIGVVRYEPYSKVPYAIGDQKER